MAAEGQATSPQYQPFTVKDAVNSIPGFQHGYYRILIKPLTIKYLVFVDTSRYSFTFGEPRLLDDPGWEELSYQEIPDFHGSRLDFNMVPAGEWNIANLVRREGSEKLHLGTTEQRKLATITQLWHPNRVDCLGIRPVSAGPDQLQYEGHIYGTTCANQFGKDIVFVCIEWSPDDNYGVARETEVFQTIQGEAIGPDFLGHVIENGDRVIGYVAERIHGRKAERDDLDACRNVLSRLHNLGIAYGKIWPHSFILTDNRIVLHSFGGAFWTNDPDIFKNEMEELAIWLA